MKDHTTAEIFEELWKRIEYDASVSEELASESNELQDRINKAIEYIENSDKYDFSKCELLDILKGSDKSGKRF